VAAVAHRQAGLIALMSKLGRAGATKGVGRRGGDQSKTAQGEDEEAEEEEEVDACRCGRGGGEEESEHI
jgi:hypothetical protein